MTHDTIRSIPPGAELDAVIAGLLGWKPRESNGVGPYWVCPDGTFQPRLQWSTNVRFAAELLVEAALRRYSVEISNGRDEDRWMVSIERMDWYAETLSEAVSKAFALAVLAQSKE
jgi:hypothetical protein